MYDFRKTIAAISTVSLVTLAFVPVAGAADMLTGIYDPPVPPVVSDDHFDWERFYGGVFVGYGIGQVDIVSNIAPSFFDRSFDISGPLAGITVGRNFLLGEDDDTTEEEDERDILVGIEADFAWADMHGDASQPFPVIGAGAGRDLYVAAGIDAIATLRGRIGLVVGEKENIVPYLTGGLAVGHAYAELQDGTPSPTLATDGWLVGYTAGAGVEMAVNEKITWKAEYLYTDLSGGLTIGGIGGPGGLDTVNYEFRSNHIFKLGLNVHF